MHKALVDSCLPILVYTDNGLTTAIKKGSDKHHTKKPKLNNV